jgi:diguanylate cyclase (GGDEF)-like protein
MYIELQEKSRVVDEKNAQLQKEIGERQRAEAALREANAKLYRLATVDGLTDVPNRRFFDDGLYQAWRRGLRTGETLSLILCDIDHFKRYNDCYGHQKGDEVLQRVAKSIEAAARRTTDLVARYGGEEFVALLPDTDETGALTIARQIQQEVKALVIPFPNSGVAETLTLSLGVATMVPQPDSDPEALIAVADAALYAAKEAGRNRIMTRVAD